MWWTRGEKGRREEGKGKDKECKEHDSISYHSFAPLNYARYAPRAKFGPRKDGTRVLNYSELRYTRVWVYTRITYAFRPLLRPLLIGINRYQIYRETHNSTRPRWHVERKLAATRAHRATHVHTHTHTHTHTEILQRRWIVGARARVYTLVYKSRRGIVYIVILCTSPRWIWIRGQRATGSSIYAANSYYLPNRRGIEEKCAREARCIGSHASQPQIRGLLFVANDDTLALEMVFRSNLARKSSFKLDLCDRQWSVRVSNLYKWVPFKFHIYL